MTKVVHIQYSSSSAGSAATRLQNAFLGANIESSIISLSSDIVGNSKIKNTGKWSKWKGKLDNKIQSYLNRKNNKQYGLFSYPILGTDVSQIEEVKSADFIYIHWALYGFLNLKSIDQLAKLSKPIIFFMHDMWNITGGCHHSFSCEKYTNHCNRCPALSSNKQKDLSYKEFNEKLKLYSKHDNLYFVSPSEWLYDCAKKSALTKDKPIFYIPNILDSSLFKPFDKKTAKQILNIGSDEIVIAFGAVSVSSPYKGWKYLQKALELLPKDQNISVLIFGSGYNKEIADTIPFRTKFLGYLKDEYSTNLVYNAADVFVAPSLAESFGYVVLESLCCGTPVVGFHVGGIPDMIKHKENGYLARYKDAEDIAEGIKFCIDEQIKGHILPEFESALTIKKHIELFDYIRLSNSKIYSGTNS